MTQDCQPKNDQHGSPLGLARRGFSGRIKTIDVGAAAHGITAAELERRLLELGFLEGAAVEVLHEGPLGRDPIAVRLNGTTIALRRREAMAVFVT
ncbi:MAG TPA: FeoA family protein [Xanthobacteraceae bacterium]|jgi:ferrous iron transport protein A